MCRHFLERFADAADHEFVGSDIPTLILTNEFDDRTPTDHARRIVASLGHAHLHELPGLGHAMTPAGCFDTIALSFLKDPTRSPDASCVGAMSRLTFETQRLDRPMLFFNDRFHRRHADAVRGQVGMPRFRMRRVPSMFH